MNKTYIMQVLKEIGATSDLTKRLIQTSKEAVPVGTDEIYVYRCSKNNKIVFLSKKISERNTVLQHTNKVTSFYPKKILNIQ